MKKLLIFIITLAATALQGFAAYNLDVAYDVSKISVKEVTIADSQFCVVSIPDLQSTTEQGEYNLPINFGESYIIGKDYGGTIFIGNTRDSWCDEGKNMHEYFFSLIKNIIDNNNSLLGSPNFNNINKYSSITSGLVLANARAQSNAGYDEILIHNLLGEPLVPLWIKEPNTVSYSIVNNDDSNKAIVFCKAPISISNIDLSSTGKTGYNFEICAIHEFEYKDNHIYCIYGDDILPNILPTNIRSIRFAEDMNFFCGDLDMGNDYDYALDADYVTVAQGTKLTIEALGDVTIHDNTNIRGEIDLYCHNNVYLKNFYIPADAVVRINAERIYQEDMRIANPENVILIERNPAPIKIAESYKPMAVPGRTWWYSSYGQGPKWLSEFGIRIGDAKNIDGKEWYPAKVILSLNTDFTSLENQITEYSTNEIPICYVREVDNEFQIGFGDVFDSSFKPLEPYFRAGDYIYPNSDLGSLYKFGEIGDESYYFSGTFNKGISYVIDSIEHVSNNGKNFKHYRTTHYPENLCSYKEHQYIECVGHPQELFLMPDMPLWDSSSIYAPAELRYVTDPDGSILYEGKGGFKLWEYDPTGVESVVVDSVKPIEKWYNLNGVEIAKPENAGVYIRKYGSTSEKVIIR